MGKVGFTPWSFEGKLDTNDAGASAKIMAIFVAVMALFVSLMMIAAMVARWLLSGIGGATGVDVTGQGDQGPWAKLTNPNSGGR